MAEPLFIPTDSVFVNPDRARSGRSEVIPSRFRSGTLTSTPRDGGRQTQADTVSCIHCGFTWIPAPGSGRLRGFCTTCNGFMCGRPFCVAIGCVHRDQVLDNLSAGRAINYKPIVG